MPEIEEATECYPVSKDTFKTFSAEQQNLVLYECMQQIHKNQKEMLKKYKINKRVQMAVSGVSGFFGGMAGFVTGLDKIVKGM